MSNYGVINGNGGQLTGVPPGFHSIMYMVSDPCGNTSQCTRIVRVIDNTPPVLVCPSSIQVSLTLTGEAQIEPSSFYLQATDLCCSNLTFKLQKMTASPLPFSDSLKYFCAEILTNNMATLQVTDCYGNSNFCMVEVDVVDVVVLVAVVIEVLVQEIVVAVEVVVIEEVVVEEVVVLVVVVDVVTVVVF